MTRLDTDRELDWLTVSATELLQHANAILEQRPDLAEGTIRAGRRLQEWRYSEDQPRDEHGRWTAGSGSEAVAGAKSPARLQMESRLRNRILVGNTDVAHNGIDPKRTEFIAKHGELWLSQTLPAGTPRGEPHECYANATRLLMQHPEYDYVEGVAWTPLVKPDAEGNIVETGQRTTEGFGHAWCVDRDGRVVDPTWWWADPHRTLYFGVRYKREDYLAWSVRTKQFGVMSNGAWRIVAEEGTGKIPTGEKLDAAIKAKVAAQKQRGV